MKRKKKALYSNEEFVEELLPRTRKEQFKFLFKTRKPLLFSLGLLLALTSIPLLVALVFKDTYFYDFAKLFNDGKINENGFLLFTLENQLVFTLICVGILLYYSIVLAGVFNLLKKVVIGDPIFFWKDFFHGIKINWLSFLIITFIFGGLWCLVITAFRFLFFDAIFIVALIVFMILIFPFFSGLYFYKSIYKATFKETLFNGLYLVRAAGIKGYLLLLGLIAIPVISNVLADYLIFTMTVNLVINLVYFLFVLPLFLLGLYCFYYSIFDIRLNKVYFVDYYRRGLYNLHENNEDSSYDKKD